MPTVTYQPGGWVAVSGAECWLIVKSDPGSDTVRRCWELISQGSGVDDVVDALLRGGVAAAPEFAAARFEGASARVLVRGSARVDAGDGKLIAARPGAILLDELVDSAVEVTLHAGEPAPDSSVELPMSAGILMARAVRIRPVPDASDVAQEPATATAAMDVPITPPPPPSAVAAQPDESDDGPSFDHLFGATQLPPAPADVPSPAVPEQTAGWQTLPPPPVPVPIEPPAPPPEPAPFEPPPPEPTPFAPAAPSVIDGVPWLPAAQEQPGPPPAPGAIDQPVAEAVHTVDRSALHAAASAEAEPVIAGPTVLAGYCPAGHLSPPHAATCRYCHAPMAPQQPFEIARPPLGVLRLSTGDVVTLDRGALLGRAPEPADPNEQPRPNVLRLASAENDISRNHAEVVLDGWHVYVRDLGSVNGTVVTLPGQAPLRLRAHDLQLLEHGTTVMLADEVSFTFEVTA